MKPIFGEVTVKMTTDDVAEIVELIQRNTPMPTSEVDETYGLVRCGACRQWLAREKNFCSFCGQRIDHDNIEL